MRTKLDLVCENVKLATWDIPAAWFPEYGWILALKQEGHMHLFMGIGLDGDQLNVIRVS